MMHRTATTAVATLLLALGTTPVALADPAAPPPPPAAAEAVPAAAPAAAEIAPAAADAAPVTSAVASEVPGIAKTSDGRTLTVAAKDETQLPVQPLTTSMGMRDWLVGGTFTGTTTGKVEGGTLEVGYQIGCSIEMDKYKLNGTIGGTFGNSTLGIAGFNAPGTISFPITGQFEVEPRPGTITNVVVDKKSFKGTSARVTLRDVHIKVDNCVGASSLRSYAVLTSSGTDNDDIVAYYGVTRVF